MNVYDISGAVLNVRDSLNGLDRLAWYMDEFSKENHDTAVLIYNTVKCGLDQLEAIDEYIDSRCKIERAGKQLEPKLQEVLDYGDYLLLTTKDGREFRAEKMDQAAKEEDPSLLELERACSGVDARSAMRMAIAESGLPEEVKRRLRARLTPFDGDADAEDMLAEINRERLKLQPHPIENQDDGKQEFIRGRLDDLIRDIKQG